MIRGGGGGGKVVKSGRVIQAGVIKRVISRHAPRNPRNRLNDPSLLQFLSLSPSPGLSEMLNSQRSCNLSTVSKREDEFFRTSSSDDEKNGESSFQISLSTSFAARIDRARFLRPSEKRS